MDDECVKELGRPISNMKVTVCVCVVVLKFNTRKAIIFMERKRESLLLLISERYLIFLSCTLVAKQMD